MSLAGAILVGALVRAYMPTPAATSAASIGYAVGIVGCALLLLLGLLATRRRADVADLVIEVGTTTGRSLQEALAWAFGDSRLRLELADADVRGGGSGAGLSDRARLGAGAALSAGPQRAVTVVFDTDGVAIAALDHAHGDLDEPGLADAVTAVVRLDVNNARLRARVAAQVDQLRESQRRLLRAADDESRRLVARLDGGAGARLGRIGKLVDEAAGLAVSDATADELADARARLDETVADLDAIGHGLAPLALARDGLAAALAGAAARSRTPLTVDVDLPELPDDIETAVYFCVVEAVTNIDKHAAAHAGQVAVTTGDGAVRIEVLDDGVGGARLSPGSGLQGVADRISALGGTLDVTSADHEGTAVRATLPLPPSTRDAGR